jgi:hypothetical protein
MAKYLKDYVKYIDDILNSNERSNFDALIKEHLIKIQFFQHERLIHLLVTLFYGIFTLAIFAFINVNALFVIPAIILIIMLLFYVKHYFLLENSVQYLYKQYDMMMEKTNKKN